MQRESVGGRQFAALVSGQTQLPVSAAPQGAEAAGTVAYERTAATRIGADDPVRNEDDIGDLEKSAVDPRLSCTLDLIRPSDPRYLYPLVDIILVQDHSRDRDGAGTYDFERVVRRSRATRSPGYQGSDNSGSSGAPNNFSQGAGSNMLDTSGVRIDQWRSQVSQERSQQEDSPAARSATRMLSENPLGISDPAVSLGDEAAVMIVVHDTSPQSPSAAPYQGQGQSHDRRLDGDVLRLLPDEPRDRQRTPFTFGPPMPPIPPMPLSQAEVVQKSDNWLHDADMLPSVIPGIRAMSYTYPTYNLSQNPTIPLDDFISRISDDLIVRFQRARSGEQYNFVPLVFIAFGFGGLIVQNVLGQRTQTADMRSAQESLLSLAAGVLFVDTPYPVFSPAADRSRRRPEPKGSPSMYGSVRMRRISDFVTQGHDVPLDTGALWDRFEAERLALEKMPSPQVLPVVWLFNKYRTVREPPDGELRDVWFRPLYFSPRLTEQQQGCRSPNYEEIRKHLSRFLVHQAATLDNLDFLEQLVQASPSAHFRGKDGRSALHVAASVPNSLAVTIIVNQMTSVVMTKDNAGQTPLHAVVLKAVATAPSEERQQKPFADVIKRLLRKTLKVDELDDRQLSAWDYADGPGFGWILALRTHRDLIQGPSDSAAPKPLEKLQQPDSLQTDVCKAFEAVLAEFFIEKKDGHRHESINYETPTVFNLIYAPGKGPDRILAVARPRGHTARVRCRWIHLPANNEQWVHDLFIRMKIRDASLDKARHEVNKSVARSMISDAKRYINFGVDQSPPTRTTSPDARPRNGVSPASNVSDPLPRTVTSRPMTLRHERTAAAGIGLHSSHMSEEISSDKSPMRSPYLADPNAVVYPIMEMQAVAVFMPILGFETHRQRQNMTVAIQVVEDRYSTVLLPGPSLPPDEFNLIKAYLKKDRPLHPRKTLDQFSYYMLETTERRDRDQVAYKWGRRDKNRPRSQRPILMVDQLWLWVLQNGTVISSFPNSWDHGENKEFDLRTVLEMELEQNKPRKAIKSPEELLHLIIKTSVSFFDRVGPAGFVFKDCFLSYINDIVEEHSTLLQRFRYTTRLLNDDIDEATRSRGVEELIELTVETKLLTEIMDVQDELKTVESLMGQQKEVLDKMLRLVRRPSDLRENSDLSEMSQGKTAPDTGAGGADGNLGPFQVLRSRTLVQENLDIVEANIKVVTDMAAYARDIQNELNHLLDLKQKQANAWETRFSRQAAEETQKQGNVLFAFAIVTIIFLPLSFIVSLIALPIHEYPKDANGGLSWPLRLGYGYIFGVGPAVLLLLMLMVIGLNYLQNNADRRSGGWFGCRRRRRRRTLSMMDSDSGSGSGPERSVGSAASFVSLEADQQLPNPTQSAERLIGDSNFGSDSEDRRGTRLTRDTGSWDVRNTQGTHRTRASRRSGTRAEASDVASRWRRWHFHWHIPGLRRLSRHKSSRRRADSGFSADGSAAQDNPFRRWVVAPVAKLWSRLWPWSAGPRRRRRRRRGGTRFLPALSLSMSRPSRMRGSDGSPRLADGPADATGAAPLSAMASWGSFATGAHSRFTASVPGPRSSPESRVPERESRRFSSESEESPVRPGTRGKWNRGRRGLNRAVPVPAFPTSLAPQADASSESEPPRRPKVLLRRASTRPRLPSLSAVAAPHLPATEPETEAVADTSEAESEQLRQGRPGPRLRGVSA